MDQAGLRAWEAKCIQEEPPLCQAGCPLEMDCRGFLTTLASGELKKARTILEKRLPLPEITARLCEAPCEGHCLRGEFGGAIAIGALERHCIENTRSTTRLLRLQPRPKSILLIGGGPSSLTAAFDLAKKGYPVTLYHTGEMPGSWLHDVAALPAAALEQELQRLRALNVTFHATPSLDAALLTAATHDAVYVGQDDHLAPELLTLLAAPDKLTFAIEGSHHFTGGFSGAGHPHRFITDIFHGRQAALSMDRFLQGASLIADRPPVRNGQTSLFTNTENVAAIAGVIPRETNRYSQEEARTEAGRCLNCQCLECVNHCVYLQQFGGYPKTYARQIYNNSAIVKGLHKANLLINSCALCGQCEEVCPNDFSMADLCLEARQHMVNEQRMPPSAQWFALEEMRSVRASSFFFQQDKAITHLFFPGCQLAGIRPTQTVRLFDHLLTIYPAMGILMDCCSAPANWAGRQAEAETIRNNLKQQWTEAGCPRLLTGCSSCLEMFRRHLPDIPTESVWSVLEAHPPAQNIAARRVAIADPCTSRHDRHTQGAIRKIIANLGLTEAPLAMSGTLTECCGFGGLMENANPELAARVTAARVKQTDAEILTYCAMCRDQLAKNGTPVVHLLDLLFPDIAHAPLEAPQTLSARRAHRRILKNTLSKRYRPGQCPQAPPWESIDLILTEGVSDSMETRRILEEDIKQVLHAVNTGRGTIFRHGDDRIASALLGEVTFWVAFHLQGQAYLIERCWSHRMTIGGMLP